MLTENLAAMIEEAPFAYAFHQLIVDDSEMNQLLFQRLVLQLYPKAKIHLAAGGSDAIALSINDEIDLILMDIQMFEIDGIKATAHIREFEKKSNTHIPIIGITAGNVLSTRDECLKAGMDDFMIKPIDGSKFKATLEHFLGGKFSSTDLDTSDVIVVPKLFADLIPAFLSSKKEQIRKMEDALSREDSEMLAALGHKIVGSASSYGFVALGEWAREVELLAKNRNFYSIAETIKKMKRHLELAKINIKD